MEASLFRRMGQRINTLKRRREERIETEWLITINKRNQRYQQMTREKGKNPLAEIGKNIKTGRSAEM
ncbi:hypothetical protein TNCV_4312431 [Trichonephila clavipes]|nr:hypothetical protein TNCV_4312431 [Trichonephila clavipes]